MKRVIILFVMFAHIAIAGETQQVRVARDPSPPILSDSPLWGSDVLIGGSEPMGRFSAIARPNGTVFLAVPDTNITPGFGLRVHKSTDFGNTWALHLTGITPAILISKAKMLRTGMDSIYCVYQTGDSIYVWNIESNVNTRFTNYPARDFDIAASATTNELYLFVDVSTTNDIRRFVSVDGGVTWGNAALVTGNGAHPRVSISTGDTLTLDYYGPVLADTATSVVRFTRYRRSGVGTLAALTFIDIVTGTARKEQYGAAIFGGRVWFFYTVGDSSDRDIRCRVSTDNGATFAPEINVAAHPQTADLWFAAQRSNNGCNLVYVSDSAGATKLMYTSAPLATPSTFSTAESIAEFPPASSSPAGYIPSLVQFYDSTNNDAGVAWVGQNRRLYWDRLEAGGVGVDENLTGLPHAFELSQNYPNPFNPTTKIVYRVESRELVSLIVFDVLGREVAKLVNEVKDPGSYRLEFDGGKLGSGVYFYTLRAGGFTATRKMLLVK